MANDEVSRDDLEQQLRSLGLGAKEALGINKLQSPIVGAVSGIVLIALSYLLGRHKGRRRATILEVRRG